MKCIMMVTSIVVTTLLASACKTKVPSQTETARGTEVAEFLNTPRHAGDTLFLSIERSGCFGTCPMYQLQVFRSGLVVYEGRKFVSRIGSYQTRIDVAEMRVMAEEAKRIGYFDLNDEYDNRAISDIPTTVTSVHAYGKSKKVSHRWQGPAELKAFEKFIDSRFESAQWEPYNMPLPGENKTDY